MYNCETSRRERMESLTSRVMENAMVLRALQDPRVIDAVRVNPDCELAARASTLTNKVIVSLSVTFFDEDCKGHQLVWWDGVNTDNDGYVHNTGRTLIDDPDLLVRLETVCYQNYDAEDVSVLIGAGKMKTEVHTHTYRSVTCER